MFYQFPKTTQKNPDLARDKVHSRIYQISRKPKRALFVSILNQAQVTFHRMKKGAQVKCRVEHKRENEIAQQTLIDSIKASLRAPFLIYPGGGKGKQRDILDFPK